MRIGAHFRLHVVALVMLLLIGAIMWVSCESTGQTADRETEPPEVYISIEPVLPEHGDDITFIAAADDESGVDTIAIFVDGENVAQCHGSPAQTHISCTDTQGPYSQGQTVQYWAFAVDCEGNSTESHIKTIRIGP